MVRYEDKEHVIDYLHSMGSFMESEKKIWSRQAMIELIVS